MKIASDILREEGAAAILSLVYLIIMQALTAKSCSNLL